MGWGSLGVASFIINELVNYFRNISLLQSFCVVLCIQMFVGYFFKQ